MGIVPLVAIRTHRAESFGWNLTEQVPAIRNHSGAICPNRYHPLPFSMPYINCYNTYSDAHVADAMSHYLGKARQLFTMNKEQV